MAYIEPAYRCPLCDVVVTNVRVYSNRPARRREFAYRVGLHMVQNHPNTCEQEVP